MKDGKHQRYKQGAAVYVEISDGAQPLLFNATFNFYRSIRSKNDRILNVVHFHVHKTSDIKREFDWLHNHSTLFTMPK